MVVLSKGGFNRILINLADFTGRLPGRLSRLHPGGLLAGQWDLTGQLLSFSADCLPVGFWLVGRRHF
jgi:hypothetical protein